MNPAEPIIDFHAHAFPDRLAARAVPFLAQEAGIKARLDGTISSLLASMDAAGIERSVICSIATKPDQFDKILEWSREIAAARILPLPSVHPASPDAVAQIGKIRSAGFVGVKLHPYYQDFVVDEPRMFPLYEALAENRLMVVCHTGFDIAYPRERRCDPVRVRRVIEQFPDLCFVATHLGAWEDWEEVERHLIGRPVYLETSFSFAYLSPERAKGLLARHPADRLLFGSDSPWAAQDEEIARVKNLGLPLALERALLYDNANRLLAASTR